MKYLELYHSFSKEVLELFEEMKTKQLVSCIANNRKLKYIWIYV